MQEIVIIDCLPESIQQYRKGYAVVVVDVIRATTTAVSFLSLVRFALTRRDQATQTVVDVKAPRVRTDVEALVIGNETEVSESHFRLVVLFRDFEKNPGAVPFISVFHKVEIAVQDLPGDPFAGNEFRDSLLRSVHVLVPVGELGAESVGVAFDVS